MKEGTDLTLFILKFFKRSKDVRKSQQKDAERWRNPSENIVAPAVYKST